MVKSFDIFFSSLVPETQKEVLKFLKLESPEDGNFDIFPLTEICLEDAEEFNRELNKRKARRKNLSR